MTSDKPNPAEKPLEAILYVFLGGSPAGIADRFADSLAAASSTIAEAVRDATPKPTTTVSFKCPACQHRNTPVLDADQLAAATSKAGHPTSCTNCGKVSPIRLNTKAKVVKDPPTDGDAPKAAPAD